MPIISLDLAEMENCFWLTWNWHLCTPVSVLSLLVSRFLLKLLRIIQEKRETLPARRPPMLLYRWNIYLKLNKLIIFNLNSICSSKTLKRLNLNPPLLTSTLFQLKASNAPKISLINVFITISSSFVIDCSVTLKVYMMPETNTFHRALLRDPTNNIFVGLCTTMSDSDWIYNA